MPNVISAFDAEIISNLEVRLLALRNTLGDITFGEWPDTGTYRGDRVAESLEAAFGSLYDALEGMWEMMEDRRAWEAVRAPE